MRINVGILFYPEYDRMSSTFTAIEILTVNAVNQIVQLTRLFRAFVLIVDELLWMCRCGNCNEWPMSTHAEDRRRYINKIYEIEMKS